MATYEVCYVGGNTTLSGDDLSLETVLNGFTDTWNITYYDDNATPPTLPGSFDVVLISETVLSTNTNVSGTYMTADIPVLNMEALSWDEGLEDIVSATGNNTNNVWEVIDATAAAHPIMTALGWADTAQKTVNTNTTTGQESPKANFGSGVQLLMQPTSASASCAAWVADTGATLNTGTATNRRAGIGFRAANYGNWTQDGKDLIEQTLIWLTSATTGGNPTAACLYIGPDATASIPDTAMIAVLEGLTDVDVTVTYRDQDLSIPVLTGYDFLFLSADCSSTIVQTSGYMDEAIPIFHAEADAWDGDSTGEDFHSATSTGTSASTTWEVIDATHEIMTHLGWSLAAAKTIASSNVNSRNILQGNLRSGVDALMKINGSSGDICFFAVETGAQLNTGVTAAERRVGFGLLESEYDVISADGEALIAAGIKWLINDFGTGTGGSVEISDDFNRANGTPGANWTEQVDSGETWDIVSNVMVGDGTNIALTHNTPLSESNQQWAEVEIAGWLDASSWREFAPVVRMLDTAGDRSGYMAYAAPATATGTNDFRVQVNRIGTTGGRVSIGSYVTGLGDLRGSKIAIAVDGSTLKLYVDEALQLTVTDTTHPSATTRESAGIWGYRGSGTDEVRFDNFRAGTGTYPPAPAASKNAGTLVISGTATVTVSTTASRPNEKNAGTLAVSATATLTVAAVPSANAGTLVVPGTATVTVGVGSTARNAGTLSTSNTAAVVVATTPARPWEKNAGTLAVANTAVVTISSFSPAGPTGPLSVSGTVGVSVGVSTQRGALALSVAGVAGLEVTVTGKFIIVTFEPEFIIGSAPSDAYRAALETGAELQTVIELLGDNDEVLASTDAARTDEVILWGAAGGDLVYDRVQRIQREFALELSVPEAQVSYFVPSSTASVLHPRSQHRVRVWGGYVLPSGDREMFVMGTFVVASAAADATSGMVKMSLICREPLEPVLSNFENAYQIASGTNVIDAVVEVVEQVLDLANNGEDGKITFTSSTTGYTTPAIDIEPGDNRREVVDQLLDGVGLEIHADERGYVVIEPIAETAIAPESQPRWEYGHNGVPVRNVRRVWAPVDAPSGVTYVGGARTEDTDPIEAQVWDSDPTSATYKVPAESGASYRVDRVENAYVRTVQQGIVAGYGYLRRNGRGGAEVVFESTPNPALRANDIVRFCDPELGIGDQMWRVDRVSMPLSPGGYMTVTLHGSWDPSLGSELDSNVDGGAPPPAPSPALISDNFNRPDENTEDDPNWTEHQWSWGLESNQQVQRYPGWSLMRWVTPFESTDHFAECTVTDIDYSTNEVGPFVRSSGQFQGYGAMAHNSGDLVIKKFTNNAPVASLGTWTEPGGFLGKTIRLEAQGNELRAYVDAVLRITVTDSSYPAGTFVGMAGRGEGGTGSANSVKVDDFAGGEV